MARSRWLNSGFQMDKKLSAMSSAWQASYYEAEQKLENNYRAQTTLAARQC